MTEQQKTARDNKLLKQCIEKWQGWADSHEAGIYEAYTVTISGCPLCVEYHRAYHQKYMDKNLGCNHCPIGKSTGKPHCAETPVDQYADMSDGKEHDPEELRQLAQAEVDFLRSLIKE